MTERQKKRSVRNHTRRNHGAGQRHKGTAIPDGSPSKKSICIYSNLPITKAHKDAWGDPSRCESYASALRGEVWVGGVRVK